MNGTPDQTIADRVRTAITTACGKAAMCAACLAKGGCGKGCNQKSPSEAEGAAPAAKEIFDRVVAGLQHERSVARIREDGVMEKLMAECRQLTNTTDDLDDLAQEFNDGPRDLDDKAHEFNHTMTQGI